MSNIKATRWAWHTEEIDNSGEAFVLVALARFANQEWLAWPSVPTLARLTRQAERTVQRHLRSLEERGCIATRPRNRDGGGWSSNVYELLGTESAPVVVDLRQEADDVRQAGDDDGAQAPAAVASVTTLVSDCHQGRWHSVTSRREVHKESLKREKYNLHAPRGRWKTINDDANDQAGAGIEVLGADADVEVPVSSPEDHDRPRRRLSSTSAPGLAQHFADHAGLAFRGFAVGNTNCRALAHHFATWKREGITPQQITSMIDVFMDRAPTYGRGKPPWKIFLGQKDALFDFVKDWSAPASDTSDTSIGAARNWRKS